MKIKKKKLGELERVYATCIMEINDELHYIVASEGASECRAIKANTLEETVIWDAPGGTMNIIPVPGRKNEFIATQKFLPTFNSAECEIVHAILDKDNNWTVTPIMRIPYLHRFDLFMIDDELHLIGGMLCNSKAFKEDWSDPGRIVTGKFHDDLTKAFELTTVYDGITKNHGFCAGNWKGKRAFFITGVEGIFIAYPPEKKTDEWIIEQLFDHEVSDCALCDIDGDGNTEIATIELFHGDKGKIYKEIDNQWQVVYERDFEFGHVVWGGIIAGKPSFIIGGRKGTMDLVLFTYDKGKFVETVIDNTGGPSNISVINLEDKDVILAANRQIGEYAVYEITV
ncbi:MAG: hypothetical protein N4A57_08880 [Anaeromicrobium sp.]|jgi:hypothetical protein|uniref:hypothetical protein n=1 Tax=Anaeromicrobium sp. TaxID=1929132 RepID=UPI0025D2866F|nr:hypothetical protein [Anaeromicrobium sp.]MCT4594365.1 hypothetical protein [Anaeromicrobium sp.]